MGMGWQDEYEKKLVSAEEAVSVVQSGDRVCFVQGMEPLALGLALAARIGDLKDVNVSVRTPGRDFGWYDPGWEESFAIEIGFPLPLVRQMIAEKRCDLAIGSLGFLFHGEEQQRQTDVVFVELSPPDDKGFCSFGASVWTKQTEIRTAKIVVAEVYDHLIRTYGENYIHVSEIDYFVKHPVSEKPAKSKRTSGFTDLMGRQLQPGEVEKSIAKHVAAIVKDGDTLQIGIGLVSEWCVALGTFDNRQDLGWHSEATPRGIIKLIREGVITGRYKTLHQHKAVATACGGGTSEDMAFVNMNPLFELYPAEHVLDVKVIAAHDNMLSINSAVNIDLTGQIAAESIGPRIISGSGGQTAFAIGSFLSKGGRFVSVLPSTAGNGRHSRIVARLQEGTIVTVPRILADLVVTEYGVAKLKGKTQRQRAMALIGIAHPDFRHELEKEARRMYWP
jgi:4-hydroxybutyrate CoA-transferase